MADKTDRRLLLPRFLRRLPADLVAVVVLVVTTNIAVFAPVIKMTPLRVIFGLPFVLFLPGYAFIAALFPEQPRSTAAATDMVSSDETDERDADDGILPRDGIDGIERVALSFGLSVAISPLIVLVLNFTPWGIRLVPIALAISGFTLVMTAVGAVRRWRLPIEERFRVPYRQWYAQLYASLWNPETRTDAVLNVVLIISLILAVSSVSYAVMFPKEGESFTTLALLNENETGELVANSYPQNLTADGNKTVVVGITNHEHQSMDYSLIVKLQRVRFGANNSVRVLEEDQLATFSVTLGNNETWRRQHTIKPTLTGDRLRLVYLLYHGNPPSEPTVTNSYRETHLWINVSDSGESPSALEHIPTH